MKKFFTFTMEKLLKNANQKDLRDIFWVTLFAFVFLTSCYVGVEIYLGHFGHISDDGQFTHATLNIFFIAHGFLCGCLMGICAMGFRTRQSDKVDTGGQAADRTI